MGARSKLGQSRRVEDFYITRQPLWGRDQNVLRGQGNLRGIITRQPLWGRDQNGSSRSPPRPDTLPDSPCGGEIKTECQSVRVTQGDYQTAPVGTRSKRFLGMASRLNPITRQPLWGRDQNDTTFHLGDFLELPDSTCGGEIKNIFFYRWKKTLYHSFYHIDLEFQFHHSYKTMKNQTDPEILEFFNKKLQNELAKKLDEAGSNQETIKSELQNLEVRIQENRKSELAAISNILKLISKSSGEPPKERRQKLTDEEIKVKLKAILSEDKMSGKSIQDQLGISYPRFSLFNENNPDFLGKEGNKKTTVYFLK